MANKKSFETYKEEFDALVEAKDFEKAVKKGYTICEKFPKEAEENHIDVKSSEYMEILKENSVNKVDSSEEAKTETETETEGDPNAEVDVVVTANHTIGDNDVIIGQKVKMIKSFFDAVYSSGKMSRYARLAE